MAVPKFHQIFLPVLKVLKHGNEQKTSDLPDQILDSGFISLTPDEASERLDSGELRYHNRVFWAVSYLSQGKFVVRPSRGMVKITQKGLDFLKNNPEKFTLKMLESDQDFQAYVPTRSKKDGSTADVDSDSMTPVNLIERGFSNLEKSLKKELLAKLHESNPYYFEKIYIQAKRYSDGNKVREPEIRNFIGAMSGDVSKGIFVTTSFFDNSAVRKAKDARNHKIILIDASQLVSLMIKYNIGIQIKNIYEVKEIDEDFFEIG